MTEQATPAHDPTRVVLMAEETAGLRLAKACLTEIQQLPALWPTLNERKQSEVIDRIRAQVETEVRALCRAVIAGERTILPAVIEGLAFKDGAKATLKISRGGEELYRLVDAVGGYCVIVLANIEEYIDDMHQLRPTPDQADLVAAAEQAGDSTDPEVKAA